MSSAPWRARFRDSSSREDFRFHGALWVAAMVLIVAGLFALARGGVALGLAQVALGVVVGVGGLALVDQRSRRDRSM